jgi:protein TonB
MILGWILLPLAMAGGTLDSSAPWRPLALTVGPAIDSTRVGLGYEVDSLTSQFVARCWRGRLQIHVRSDHPFAGTDTAAVVRVMLDGQPSSVENWPVSRDRRSLFSREPDRLAEQLLGARRAGFAFEGRRTLAFDVSGFEAPLARMRRACSDPGGEGPSGHEQEGPVAIATVPPEDPRPAPHSSANVILQCLVGEDGRVEDAKVVESPPSMHVSALSAVREWRFKPAYSQHQPTAMWTLVQVLFPASSAPSAGSVAPHPEPPADDEELPVAVSKVPPIYPDEARELGVTGTVVVQVFIDEEGKVIDTKVVRSIPGLDTAAVASVRQWRFKPARTGGKPVRVWTAIPVRFSIDGK